MDLFTAKDNCVALALFVIAKSTGYFKILENRVYFFLSLDYHYNIITRQTVLNDMLKIGIFSTFRGA